MNPGGPPDDFSSDEQTAAEFLAELRADARARRWVVGEPPHCSNCGARAIEPVRRADRVRWTAEPHLPYCRSGRLLDQLPTRRGAGFEPVPLTPPNEKRRTA